MPCKKGILCDYCGKEVTSFNNRTLLHFCSNKCKYDSERSIHRGNIRLECNGRIVVSRDFTRHHKLKDIYSRWLEVYEQGEIIVTFN